MASLTRTADLKLPAGYPSVPTEKKNPPEHEAIYYKIRDLILFGVLVPGQAVTIGGLCEKIGAGMTPVREAIRRLTAEGALEAGGNRRVRVPEITRAKLDQLGFARLAIEPHLASLAAENPLSAEQISMLTNVDERINQAISSGDIASYLEGNYRFHFELYELAQASVLTKIVVSLWLQVGPSLRIVCGRHGTANLPDQHHEALAALAARDPERTARAIEEDIKQGLNLIQQTLID